MIGQPVRPREISGLIAWAARLSRTGSGGASPAEAAAYLAAKADLLDRIAPSKTGGPAETLPPPAKPRPQPGWPPSRTVHAGRVRPGYAGLCGARL